MAEVSLPIGGRSYVITCRDGDEARLQHLATLVDAKTQDARRAVPGLTEVRQLLFAALFLADELNDIRTGELPAHSPAPDPRLSDALEKLADRMESVVSRLAASPQSA
ncbi:cell division protein ZapA [Rhizorhapis suberifaciens]|uniref:Cell division protein ZapA n=1 Tax=Rhizorhapis suberifaciens TaxID=13656 RepID=A0A840HTJ0_9SPHN|nr:cell division protein ZapA [Rhizorhapis suberifaciens]MBB4641502.1 cell division protein ZapA [Rhizorhapis suberifaciens]